MKSVEVRWDACGEEGVFIARDQTTILAGDWADCEANGESAVGDICEDYFRIYWADDFGDDLSGRVTIEVYSPESIAGTYDVDLSRPVKASATRTKP